MTPHSRRSSRPRARFGTSEPSTWSRPACAARTSTSGAPMSGSRSWSKARTSTELGRRVAAGAARRRPPFVLPRIPPWLSTRPLERYDRRLESPRAPVFVNGLDDRQVLDRETGGVEQGDLLRRAASLGGSGEHIPELGDVLAAHLRREDAVRELAAGTGLLPLIAEEPAALDRLELDLLLAMRVRAKHRDVLARPKVARQDHRLVARGDRDDNVLRGGLGTIPDAPAELRRQALGDLGADVGAGAGPVADRGEAAGRPGAVHPAADDPDRARALGRQRFGGDRGRGAGPERGDRGALDHRQLLSRLGVGKEDLAPNHRQALGAVARKRGHPLEQRQPIAAGGHRPEVAVRRAVKVDLRRHFPLAAG